MAPTDDRSPLPLSWLLCLVHHLHALFWLEFHQIQGLLLEGGGDHPSLLLATLHPQVPPSTFHAPNLLQAGGAEHLRQHQHDTTTAIGLCHLPPLRRGQWRGGQNTWEKHYGIKTWCGRLGAERPWDGISNAVWMQNFDRNDQHKLWNSYIWFLFHLERVIVFWYGALYIYINIYICNYIV